MVNLANSRRYLDGVRREEVRGGRLQEEEGFRWDSIAELLGMQGIVTSHCHYLLPRLPESTHFALEILERGGEIEKERGKRGKRGEKGKRGKKEGRSRWCIFISMVCFFCPTTM